MATKFSKSADLAGENVYGAAQGRPLAASAAAKSFSDTSAAPRSRFGATGTAGERFSGVSRHCGRTWAALVATTPVQGVHTCPRSARFWKKPLTSVENEYAISPDPRKCRPLGCDTCRRSVTALLSPLLLWEASLRHYGGVRAAVRACTPP